MTDDRLLGLVASLALLAWLVGRGTLRGRQRQIAEMAAYGLLAAGVLYAVFLSLRYYSG